MWAGFMGTMLALRSTKAMHDQIERVDEIKQWHLMRDELHRRMDAYRVVAGAALRQHQRALARIEDSRKALAAHMERKPR